MGENILAVNFHDVTEIDWNSNLIPISNISQIFMPKLFNFTLQSLKKGCCETFRNIHKKRQEPLFNSTMKNVPDERNNKVNNIGLKETFIK